MRLLEWEQTAAAKEWTNQACDELAQRIRTAPLVGEQLRFLLCVATVGRYGSVRHLLDSLACSRDFYGYRPDAISLLLVHNTPEPNKHLPFMPCTSIPFAEVHTSQFVPSIVRWQELRIAPATLPSTVPIGVSRMVQSAAVRQWWRRERFGHLPHPSDGKGPIAIWVLDDDLSVAQLVVRHGRRRIVNAMSPLHRLDLFHRLHPEIDAVIGGNLGDPPVPAYTGLRVQVSDLFANLRMMADLPLDSPWEAPSRPRHLPDFYYDHSRVGQSHLTTNFAWEPPDPGHAVEVEESLVSLMDAVPAVNRGAQVMRPLTWEPTHLAPAPSAARGGNTVFFCPELLFSLPCPCMDVGRGVITRRGDTLWGHLASRQAPGRVAAAAIPLLHGRTEDDLSSPTSGSTRPSRAEFLRFVAGQEVGTVLATLMEGGEVGVGPLRERVSDNLAQRRASLRRAWAHTRLEVETLRIWLRRRDYPTSWTASPKLASRLSLLGSSLLELHERFHLDEDEFNLPIDLAAVADFAEGLAERSQGFAETIR